MTFSNSQDVSCASNSLEQSQICDLADLKNIWDKKEYRIFPVSILKHLRSSELSDAAILCWQTLLEKAYFDEQWEIEISKAELGKELRKSSSTVSRLIEQLEQAGFIYKKSFKINNINLKNCISVRFPQHVIQKILSTTDRKKETRLTPQTHQPKLTSTIHVLRETCPENRHTNSTVPLSDKTFNSIHEKDHQEENKMSSSNIFKNNFLKKVTAGKTLTLLESKNADGNMIDSWGKNNKEIVFLDLPSTSKMEEGLSVFESYTYNNIIINNKINNNIMKNLDTGIQEEGESVVVFLNDKYKNTVKSIDECSPPGWYEKKERLNQLEEEIKTKIQETFTHSTNLSASERYILTRELGEKESQILRAKQQLEQEKAVWQKQQHEQAIDNILTHDNTCIQQLPGGREVTFSQLTRLQYNLKKLNLDETELYQRMNEIVYEVRFGSLMTAQNKQHKLSIDHGINIALKLLRENRWSTPTGLKAKWSEFMSSTNHQPEAIALAETG